MDKTGESMPRPAEGSGKLSEKKKESEREYIQSRGEKRIQLQGDYHQRSSAKICQIENKFIEALSCVTGRTCL